MGKRVVELHFNEVNTTWVVDTEKHDRLVMVGFEECVFSPGKETEVFKTEQLLDVEDLKMLRILIDRTLKEME